MNLIINLTEYTMYMNFTVINLISYLLKFQIREFKKYNVERLRTLFNFTTSFEDRTKKHFCSDSYNISLTGNLYFLYLIDIFYRWCFDHGDLTYQNWDIISCKCLCSKLLNSNKQGFNISSWAYFFLLNLKLPKF